MTRKAKYLLDSDLLIATLRGNADARATLEHFLRYEDCALSVVAYTEVATGEYMRDPRVSRSVRDFLDPIPALDYTRAMAQRAARVHAQVRAAGRQMGLGDLQIAATAAFSKRVLLTRNTAHFALFVDQDKQLELREW